MEERDELSNIRRRKKELLDDIEVSNGPSMMFFFVIVGRAGCYYQMVLSEDIHDAILNKVIGIKH